MSKISYYSKEALEKLRSDLDNLCNIERPKISEQIAQARDKGDLSENAEYDAAKEAQGLLEMRISDLEQKLLYARVIDTSKLDDSKVLLYCTVKIKNVDTDQIFEYTLVSESEADLSQGKISANSPIGKGLLTKVKGDIAEIVIPTGILKFQIIEISRK